MGPLPPCPSFEARSESSILEQRVVSVWGQVTMGRELRYIKYLIARLIYWNELIRRLNKLFLFFFGLEIIFLFS